MAIRKHTRLFTFTFDAWTLVPGHFVPLLLTNSGERLFSGIWGILSLFSFNLPALIITSNPKDPASCVKSTKSFPPSKSYCPSTFSWTCHAMYLWGRRHRSISSYKYLLFEYSPFHCQRFHLRTWIKVFNSIKTLSALFELYYRIVLGKKNETPSTLFHGFVWYSLQDKTQGRTTHQPYILRRPYLPFFFFLKKEKVQRQPGILEVGLKICFLLNHYSKGAVGTNSRYLSSLL